MKKQQHNFGFTLIELVVVIGVIGILASIVYASFGNARASARDDIRQSSLKEVQLAIELYKAQNGEYPLPASSCNVPGNRFGGPLHGTYPCDKYIDGLVPDFIAALPRDPLSEAGDQGYLYQSNGNDYKLMSYVAVETKLVTSYENELARCSKKISNDSSYCGNTPQPSSYAVYSAGAWDW